MPILRPPMNRVADGMVQASIFFKCVRRFKDTMRNENENSSCTGKSTSSGIRHPYVWHSADCMTLSWALSPSVYDSAPQSNDKAELTTFRVVLRIQHQLHKWNCPVAAQWMFIYVTFMYRVIIHVTNFIVYSLFLGVKSYVCVSTTGV